MPRYNGHNAVFTIRDPVTGEEQQITLDSAFNWNYTPSGELDLSSLSLSASATSIWPVLEQADTTSVRDGFRTYTPINITVDTTEWDEKLRALDDAVRELLAQDPYYARKFAHDPYYARKSAQTPAQPETVEDEKLAAERLARWQAWRARCQDEP